MSELKRGSAYDMQNSTARANQTTPRSAHLLGELYLAFLLIQIYLFGCHYYVGSVNNACFFLNKHSFRSAYPAGHFPIVTRFFLAQETLWQSVDKSIAPSSVIKGANTSLPPQVFAYEHHIKLPFVNELRYELSK
jgi:hypothetical protein